MVRDEGVLTICRPVGVRSGCTDGPELLVGDVLLGETLEGPGPRESVLVDAVPVDARGVPGLFWREQAGHRWGRITLVFPAAMACSRPCR